MSQPFDADGSEAGLPHPSALHLEAVTEVFTHLDQVIAHATKAQRHSRHTGDDKSFDALDDAISLLQHVKSRLKYDLAETAEQELGPAL